jgi:hypothetical protein
MKLRDWVGREVEITTKELDTLHTGVTILWAVESLGIIVSGGVCRGTHFIPYTTILGITLKEEQ